MISGQITKVGEVGYLIEYMKRKYQATSKIVEKVLSCIKGDSGKGRDRAQNWSLLA